MLLLEIFIEIYLIVFINLILLAGVLIGFALSLDPYAPPEQNLAFLMLSLLPISYWLWAYLTRKDPIKFWQIF